ncbi:cysteine--tRNA ligase [Candidatus Wolfebacteria bacterium]|nr:MAG: cysteine--tRNA ligase [Candidatus Wolfebacteria bacterium]
MFSFFKSKKKKQESQPLYFYNTQSKDNKLFKPLNSRQVSMYNCGPTVYNRATIGNLRAPIVGDLIKRILKYNNYLVRQVMNITDIGHLTSDADTGDDKMLMGLKRESKPITIEAMHELGEHYTELFLDDIEQLNILTPEILPRASEHILDQVAFIKTLDEKGYIYKTTDGVYFDTSRFQGYGKLGGISLEHQEEGARIMVNSEKRHPQDFALWKFNKEFGWESPWGKGSPGWHIECSAMIHRHLGRQIDIHTGGIEHIPTHHNNEIAQSEALTGKPFVGTWMHHAHIQIEGRKISKSLGNTIYLHNIVERGFSPLAYRYWLLTGHYRTPMNFTWEALEGAQKALFRLHKYFTEELRVKNGRVNIRYQKLFHKYINDDVDTPRAIALVWELVKDTLVPKGDKRATLLDFDNVLGFNFLHRNSSIKLVVKNKVKAIPADVDELFKERNKARKNKNWAEADRIRDELYGKGFNVIDANDSSKLEQSDSSTG